MTTMTMTTDEATRELGRVLEYGQPDEPGCSQIDAARRHGRAWRWEMAGHALMAAYRALGAEPPPVGSGSAMAHGYAWHSGSHPIQLAGYEAVRELEDSLERCSAPRPPQIQRPGPVNPPGDTIHLRWLAIVAAGEAEGASIEEMDGARLALAARADRLARKPGARREVESLRARYDAVLGRLLAAGWR